MPTDEEVLVIPTQHLRSSFGEFLGFRETTPAQLAALLDPALFSYQPRSRVESDPNFKQLIPYVILQYGEHLFTYRRGAAGTEKRLTALRSLGIGGHIARSDGDSGNPYWTGMRRELQEEVTIALGYHERFLGLINDDRTFVGQVHLGLAHLLELASPEVRSNEEALADGQFLPLDQLRAERDSFETWSQFAMDAITSRGREPAHRVP